MLALFFLLLASLFSFAKADCVANNKTYKRGDIYDVDVLGVPYTNGKRYRSDRVRFRCVQNMVDGSLEARPIACIQNYLHNIKLVVFLLSPFVTLQQLGESQIHRDNKYEYFCFLSPNFTGLLSIACMTEDGQRFTAGQTAKDSKYDYDCKLWGYLFPGSVQRRMIRCRTRKGTTMGSGWKVEDGLRYGCHSDGDYNLKLVVYKADE